MAHAACTPEGARCRAWEAAAGRRSHARQPTSVARWSMGRPHPHGAVVRWPAGRRRRGDEALRPSTVGRLACVGTSMPRPRSPAHSAPALTPGRAGLTAHQLDAIGPSLRHRPCRSSGRRRPGGGRQAGVERQGQTRDAAVWGSGHRWPLLVYSVARVTLHARPPLLRGAPPRGAEPRT